MRTEYPDIASQGMINIESALTRSKLTNYADAFLPMRYQDPHYQNILSTWHEIGQLRIFTPTQK